MMKREDDMPERFECSVQGRQLLLCRRLFAEESLYPAPRVNVVLFDLHSVDNEISADKVTDLLGRGQYGTIEVASESLERVEDVFGVVVIVNACIMVQR